MSIAVLKSIWPKTFLLFSFLGLALCFSVEASQRELTDAYLLYCQNEIDQGDAILDELLKREPTNYFALSLKEQFLADRLERYFENIISRFGNENPQLPSDRLTLARALLHFEEPELDRIASLLDFQSQNPTIESLRLSSRAVLLEIQQPEAQEEAARIYEEAYLVYGGNEPGLLHPLVVGSDESAYLQDLARRYRPQIQKIDERDPWRDYLQMEVNILEERASFAESLGLAQQIKERCPQDLQFRYAFGIIAAYSQHAKLAHEEFLSLSQLLTPWSGLYFYLGTTAAVLQKWHEALEYFDKALEGGPYLRPEYRSNIEQVRPFVEQQIKAAEQHVRVLLLAVAVVAAFALMAIFVLRSIFKKIRSR